MRLPPWVMDSPEKLGKLIKYATDVFGLPHLLGRLVDSRRQESVTHQTLDVVQSLFFAGVLRCPSINAIEGELKQAPFQKLIGRPPAPDKKAFSAEVIYNVLDKLELEGLRHNIEDVIWTAERNKVFRDGSYGTLRCVAIDGWEPFCSYERHCPECLTREVSVKDPATGEIRKRTQYYHRYVVAMLIDPVMDMVLGIEPIRNAEARRDLGEDAHHEGELTAAYRLIKWLRATYGTFIDALVMDALYANGPTMSLLKSCGYGGLIVLKKEHNEPLKEALALWGDQAPCETFDDPDNHEHVELWDVQHIDTLQSYGDKLRVVRGRITKKDGSRSTWCFALVGDRLRTFGRRTALKAVRGRWHLENTGFGQWVQYWNLGRVFHHTNNAIQALLLIWMLVFNLLQLFIFRRLRRSRRPKDPCDTIINIVAQMRRAVGAIPEPIAWEVLADAATS